MTRETLGRANHPGRILERYLDEKNWSQKIFAELIGKSPVEVNYIIKGKKDINADFAIRFGIVFGTSAEVWTNLQEKYDLYKASQSTKQNEYVAIEERLKIFAFA